jgi:hypothetical protein
MSAYVLLVSTVVATLIVAGGVVLHVFAEADWDDE